MYNYKTGKHLIILELTYFFHMFFTYRELDSDLIRSYFENSYHFFCHKNILIYFFSSIKLVIFTCNTILIKVVINTKKLLMENPIDYKV